MNTEFDSGNDSDYSDLSDNYYDDKRSLQQLIFERNTEPFAMLFVWFVITCYVLKNYGLTPELPYWTAYCLVYIVGVAIKNHILVSTLR